MTTYVVDIDGTIKERIEKINKLHEQGHEIIYMTARGMGRHSNNPQAAIQEFYAFTKSQLDEWGCKYDMLFLGKPAADFYIDDKGINDEDFFTD